MPSALRHCGKEIQAHSEHGTLDDSIHFLSPHPARALAGRRGKIGSVSHGKTTRKESLTEVSSDWRHGR